MINAELQEIKKDKKQDLEHDKTRIDYMITSLFYATLYLSVLFSDTLCSQLNTRGQRLSFKCIYQLITGDLMISMKLDWKNIS